MSHVATAPASTVAGGCGVLRSPTGAVVSIPAATVGETVKICLLYHTSKVQSHHTWLGTCICTFQVFDRLCTTRNQIPSRTGLKLLWGQSERPLRTCSPELLLAIDSPRVLGETVVEKVCDIDTRMSPRLLLHPIYIHIKRSLARRLLMRPQGVEEGQDMDTQQRGQEYMLRWRATEGVSPGEIICALH